MADKYVFTICDDQEPEITIKECRKDCCSAKNDSSSKTIKISSLPSRYEARVKEIVGKSVDATAETLKQLKTAPSNRTFEPFAIICELYNEYFFSSLEKCLNRKLNISDCIHGCYTGIIDFPRNRFRVHSHQYRNYANPKYRPSFGFMTDEVNRTIGEQTFNCFDDIIKYLENIKAQHKKEATGFGGLSIYDAAQRIAWHAPKKQREKLMPTEVFLHQGVLTGASALWRLGLMPEYKKMKYGLRIPISDLPAELQSLPAYHLENLMCIFHELFEIWSPVPEKKKTNKKN